MNDDKTIKKSYWAVTPADVRYNKNLPDGAKLLYGEITALCNERGYCWASNKYFSDLYGNDPRTISRWVSALEKEGHIYLKLVGKDRKIFLANPHTFDIANVQEPEPVAEDSGSKKKKDKKEVEPVKAKENKYTDQDLMLAEMLLSKIILNFPQFENKKVKTAEWAEEMRKLREIDKATPDQIMFMITWIHGGDITLPGKPSRSFEPHDFWSRNIMSAKKMRKQWFDNLVPQLQQSFKKQIKKQAVAQL